MSNLGPTDDRSSDQETEPPRPWWREPWPWLLMLGPAVAVVGCAITMVLAFQSYGSQPIEDGGVKQGLHVSGPATTPPRHP